jgi:hypothetical protein
VSEEADGARGEGRADEGGAEHRQRQRERRRVNLPDELERGRIGEHWL